MKLRLVLATSSSSRVTMFKELDVPFVMQASDVDESIFDRSDPETLVRHLAKEKALAVAKNYPNSIVIGFDSVTYFKGKIREKPKSKKEAEKRLTEYSGKAHDYITGIYGINTKTGKNITITETTKIVARRLTKKEIRRYLNQTNEYLGFALGYNAFGSISASFVRKIEGNIHNVQGIPLDKTIEIIAKLGLDIRNII